MDINLKETLKNFADKCKAVFASVEAIDEIKDGSSIDSFSDVETALELKQNALTAGNNITILGDNSINAFSDNITEDTENNILNIEDIIQSNNLNLVSLEKYDLVEGHAGRMILNAKALSRSAQEYIPGEILNLGNIVSQKYDTSTKSIKIGNFSYAKDYPTIESFGDALEIIANNYSAGTSPAPGRLNLIANSAWGGGNIALNAKSGMGPGAQKRTYGKTTISGNLIVESNESLSNFSDAPQVEMKANVKISNASDDSATFNTKLEVDGNIETKGSIKISNAGTLFVDTTDAANPKLKITIGSKTYNVTLTEEA